MGLDTKVSDDSSVVATKEQVSSDLAGEAVILNIKSGVYYGLNAVGARIWNLIQEQKTVKEVRDTILAEYDVEPEQCDRELLEILQQLESEGLIEVKNETAA
jgi:hypothetical protein